MSRSGDIEERQEQLMHIPKTFINEHYAGMLFNQEKVPQLAELGHTSYLVICRHH